MATRRPNVIVFFTDQQRWDSTGVHGNPLDLTPNFDRMARRGTHCHNAFTCQPVCGPVVRSGGNEQKLADSMNKMGRERNGTYGDGTAPASQIRAQKDLMPCGGWFRNRLRWPRWVACGQRPVWVAARR